MKKYLTTGLGACFIVAMLLVSNLDWGRMIMTPIMALISPPSDLQVSTVKELIEGCRYVVKGKSPSEGDALVLTGLCAGRIETLVELMAAGVGGQQEVWVPKGVTLGQAAKLLVDFFDRNPVFLTEPFSAAAWEGFYRAWPCPKPQ
jgi:hypothetical protein